MHLPKSHIEILVNRGLSSENDCSSMHCYIGAHQMEERNGVIKTAKEAILCKASSAHFFNNKDVNAIGNLDNKMNIVYESSSQSKLSCDGGKSTSDTIKSNINNTDNSKVGSKPEKKRLQNPLLNRLYHTRYLLIHKMVSKCLSTYKENYNTIQENYKKDKDGSKNVFCKFDSAKIIGDKDKTVQNSDNMDSKSNTDSKCCQLLILGAGVDISFEKLYSHLACIYAVDLPEIIIERDKLLSQNEEGDTPNNGRQNIDNTSTDSNNKRSIEKIEEYVEDEVRNSKCNKEGIEINQNSKSISIAGDLCDFDDIWKKLLLNGFDVGSPTIVVVECVLCYIDTPSVKSLLQKLSGNLKESLLIIYDPMLPPPPSIPSDHSYQSRSLPLSLKDSSDNMTRSSTSTSHNENKTFNNGFSKMMQDKFSERNAPIRHCIPSVKKQQNFIQTCNWKFVNSFNMHEASQLFLNKHERSISTSLEPFDEFSSLALLHKQYSVTLGGLGRYLHQSTLQDLLKFHTVNFQKLHHSRGNDEGRILHSLLQRIRLAESSIQVLGQKIKNFVVVNRDIPVRSTIKICTKCGVNIVLREATNDDSQDIISIFQQCFKSVSEKFVAVRKFVKKSVKNLKDLEIEYCKKRGSNFWVAEVLDDGSTSSKIVGCIGLKSVKIFDPRDNLSSHRESQGEVSHMCVDSQHQKQGIAQALLEYLITYVQDSIRGISHIPNKFPTTKDSVMFNENNHKMKDRSLDLTLLSGLDSAKALYVKMGFLDKGVLVDLGGNCFLQHMSLDV